jgi:peptide methionine sulfoxide reductase MsrB
VGAEPVSSWGPDRLDVFAAGADGQLIHKWWDGSAWSDWDRIGGAFHGNPAAVSWGTKRIDVFVQGTDNHLGHLWRG